MKIALNQDDFRKLVHGETLQFASTKDPGHIQLVLSSIDYGKMAEAIRAAMLETEALMQKLVREQP